MTVPVPQHDTMPRYEQEEQLRDESFPQMVKRYRAKYDLTTEENGVRVWQHLPGTFYMDGGMAEFVVVASQDYRIDYDDGEDEEGDGFISISAFDEDGQYYDYTHVGNGETLTSAARGLSCTIYDNRSGEERETTITFTCGVKTITYIFRQLPILSSRLIAPQDLVQYEEQLRLYRSGKIETEPVLPVYGKSDLTLEWASVPGVARYELCRLIIDPEENGWNDRYDRIGDPILPTTSDSFTTVLPASFWNDLGLQGDVYIVMLTYDAWGNQYKNHPFSSTQPEYRFRMVLNDDTLDFDYDPVYDVHTGSITGVSITGYHGAETDLIIPSTLNGFAVTAVAERAFNAWFGAENTRITSVVIPEGATRIGHWAFGGCTSLKHVTIPNSVTDIESQAFDGCESLTEIVIPEGVTGIGGSAFSECSALLSLTIPGNVIEIGQDAFESCTNLESVVIEDGVEWIGNDAFRGCDKLTDIFIPASVVYIEHYGYGGCFSGCDNLTIHGIPGTCAEAYANEHGIPFAAISN